MQANRFRKDLFYRINPFILNVPPLRERKEDIPLLVDYFMTKLGKGGETKRVSARAMKVLRDYQWPGNIRELANVFERAMLLSAGRDEIFEDDFPLSVRDGSTGRRLSQPAGVDEDLKLEVIIRRHIEKVLRRTGGNKSEAARLLGISRKKLYSNIEGE